ncbi:MAG TPA: chemotaxis response regulator protein-glutamate methylesterase [Syntrophorhabdus sp.]|jgi:two-component system chemotaxis response regulator CheB|nr:chemotaxis response regulator protein-glutamate methylesterase [Syntrophorhabdus sp.]OPX94432.1 MAG: Chemotaxis response regulator protein-glutamate methylesterase [Syntrophorhabdus sp. PtaB.Bin027]OQB77997.1 MAG: Chemotaxis response regulator protein-glutamate methylesterase [Deltaproteobacteria bacterium ADurb.Bin135]HOD77632.1 chemotaxis response regulator protein-glutamate methylesterase [Syntrophorhabdus sp.]HPB36875.1 chemotaxis response regulator protein-glutamate methylesterase [Synt
MIRVIVVDDSSFMRSILTRMLEKDKDIKVVETAANGEEAIDKIERVKPDVVTLDIEMPVMNGIEALTKIMATNPVPVIVLSALTREGAEVTMEALNLGACDFMTKDISDGPLGMASKEAELIGKVKDVAKRKFSFLVRRLELLKRPVLINRDKRSKHAVLSIGASTGGPPALQHILTSFPQNFPVPIVIAQHMPKLFTQSFARRLNGLSQIEVKEAEDKEPLRPGLALIAPGDVHMGLKKNGKDITVDFVKDAQYVYRPSVDHLMFSTAQIYDSSAIGVILTGMGNDGLVGLKELKRRNGFVIAQDEETCVVFGMPKAVINANIADVVLPIERISEEIIRVL